MYVCMYVYTHAYSHLIPPPHSIKDFKSFIRLRYLPKKAKRSPFIEIK